MSDRDAIDAIQQRHDEEHPYHREHFGKFGWNAHIDRAELLAAVDARDAEIQRLRDGLREISAEGCTRDICDGWPAGYCAKNPNWQCASCGARRLLEGQ